MTKQDDVSLDIRLLVWREITDVLFKHYGEYIMDRDNPVGYAAWLVMQDIRTHLNLTVEETDKGY